LNYSPVVVEVERMNLCLTLELPGFFCLPRTTREGSIDPAAFPEYTNHSFCHGNEAVMGRVWGEGVTPYSGNSQDKQGQTASSQCVTVFLPWFGSFLEIEMSFSKHGQIPKLICSSSQQNGIYHNFHQISNAFVHVSII